MAGLKRSTGKTDARCWFCKTSINPVHYSRLVVEGISYASCSSECPQAPTNAIYVGEAGPVEYKPARKRKSPAAHQKQDIKQEDNHDEGDQRNLVSGGHALVEKSPKPA